jgi:PAS domain S-box-containing protein
VTHAALLAAFSQAPLAMALVEPRDPFTIIAANQTFANECAAVDELEALCGRPIADVTRLKRHAADAVLDLLRRVAGNGRIGTAVQFDPDLRTYAEVTVSVVREGPTSALLYTTRDVTAREEQRRRLSEATERLVTLTRFARDSLSFDTEAQLAAIVQAASSIARGSAAVYLSENAGELRLAAVSEMRDDEPQRFPNVLAPPAFALVRDTFDSGSMSRIVHYAPDLPVDERTLMRALASMWLAIVPVQARRSKVGVLLTFSRSTNVLPEQLQILEACAGQLALTSEQAQLFRTVDKERAELALVLEQIPDAVVIADERGKVAHANPSARRLLGTAPDSLVMVSTGVAGNGNAGADLGLRRALSGETVRGVVEVVRSPTDEPTWLMTSAAPLQAPNGSLNGAVAVATDITEHRRAEESLRVVAEVSAALSGSLDYRGTLPTVARLLVPRVGDVCAIDVFENDVPARIALAHADAVSAELASKLAHHPEPMLPSGERQPRLISDVTAGVLHEIASDREHESLLRTLGLRSCMLVPIAARGRTYGMLWLGAAQSGRRYVPESLLLAEDVARRIASAIDNTQLFHDAQEADRRKDEFLAILSHELRTPLAPIMAWAQVLKRTADPERLRLAIEVIERNVRLQTALIDDLLDLTAITRGKVALDTAVHDLRTIVETAMETVREKVVEKSIVLACDLPDSPVAIECDANRLQQVVWNLLTNSIKFSTSGGRVVISVRAENDRAVLRVRDLGAGIAAEFLPQVFDMFRQQERGARRSYGGLGIGLAIARRVTELHRGTIDVHSEGPGKGAEFCVRLPLAPATSFSVASEPSTAPLRERAVLLVEDVPDMREAARAVLEDMGIEVFEAAEGVEALARLEEVDVDLVVCDLRMPLMDGFELIRRIRDDPRHRALPVIAVSGYATRDDERRTRDAGFDDYVRKPFVESTLAATIARVLQQRERTVEA